MKTCQPILCVLIATCFVVATTSCSNDQDFPDSSIEILVPFSPGGGADLHARAFAEALSPELGVEVTVVNREGGASAVGTTEAANATPDGYETFLAAASAFTTVPLTQDVQYSHEDFISIQPIADQPYMIVADSDSDFQNLEDISQTSERITYATNGTGHLTHLTMASTLDSMGVTGESIPYESAGDSLQAVTSGQVDVGVINLNVTAPQVEAGTVTPLAVSTTERHEEFPDVVALAETDWPEGAGYIPTFTWAVPSDTPEDVIETVSDAGKAAFASEEYQEYMRTNYLEESDYAGESWFSELIPQLAEDVSGEVERLGLQ